MRVKAKIYLETTLFNYYFLNDSSRRADIEATKQLFEEIAKGLYQGFVSPETIREMRNNTDLQACDRMISFIQERGFVLLQPRDFAKIEELAKRYVKAGAIPEKKLPDARHIAIATISGMDILASWNQRHIVRYRTQSIIQAINAEHNLSLLLINTPPEIITYEEPNSNS